MAVLSPVRILWVFRLRPLLPPTFRRMDAKGAHGNRPTAAVECAKLTFGIHGARRDMNHLHKNTDVVSHRGEQVKRPCYGVFAMRYGTKQRASEAKFYFARDATMRLPRMFRGRSARDAACDCTNKFVQRPFGEPIARNRTLSKAIKPQFTLRTCEHFDVLQKLLELK